MDIQVEYVIIDKKAIENRLEKLKVFQYHNQEAIYELEQILSQSTPLIPEIEKSFDSGVNSVILKIINEKDNTIGHSKGFTTRVIGEWVEPYPREYVKKDYLSNLKLDI